MTSDPWAWTETFSRTDRPSRYAQAPELEEVEGDYAVIPPAGEPATTGRVILHREEGSRA